MVGSKEMMNAAHFDMQNLHEYPRNLGGAALLLLRLSIGLLLVRCVHAGGPNAIPTLLMILATAISAGLVAGILTRTLCGIIFVSGIILLCSIPAYVSIVNVATLLLLVATSLVGAGAYSLDAMLFGRKRIIL
jgi:hypothetical protein